MASRRHSGLKTWYCKIGEVAPADVPQGADLPMREAVARAYKRITGEDDVFIFSGWGAQLTESERAVVENREPEFRGVVGPAPCPNCSAADPFEADAFTVLGRCIHGVDLDREFCSQGCRV